ncbi:MAG: ribbon-helix-helix domain-containing protein [Eubacteriales bacterium]|nr:ribbon-helix-helix domain-containing protein [Eubacteriales bacterium]
MSNGNDAVRTGIYISRSLLKKCDENMPKTNASSRSEFISDAIEMYIAWLNSKENSRVLTPALESVIGAKISDTENRLARLLFKLSVEMAMMMNVVAASNEVDKESLDRLRGSCVKEVKRLGGNFSFEDAVEWQKE